MDDFILWRRLCRDIQTNLKSELSNVLDMKICSADTLLRLQKELCLAKEIHLGKQNTRNEFSKNNILNSLNLSILLLTKQLNPNQGYALDFDNQFIACEKHGAKKSYKMMRGYFPGIAAYVPYLNPMPSLLSNYVYFGL